MKHVLLSVWTTAVSLLAVTTSLAAEVKASSLLSESRLLVMCLPDFETVRHQLVLQSYFKMDWDGFAERDLLLIEVDRDAEASRLVGLQPDLNRSPIISDVSYDSIEGQQVIRQANCNKDYELILIGKDTGVKARWTNDFSEEDLFNRIDAMPMRRFEMRQKLDKN